MDSNNELEQPIQDSGAGIEQPSNQGSNIQLTDGTEVTLDELKSGYMRQSDYTKKTQALAEEKKEPNPELDKTVEILKEAGFATVDELTDLKKFRDETLSEKQSQTLEKEFTDFSTQHTTLSESQKGILRDLKKVYSNKSYDDILKTTGFIDQSLLEKSKSNGGVIGASLGIPEPKEELKISKKLTQKFNLKSSSELSDIKSKFNL